MTIKSGLGCSFARAREPRPSISSSATNIMTCVPRHRSRCDGGDGRPRQSPHRPLRVTSASAEELAVLPRQMKRIAAPAAADQNCVHMRVESETRAGGVIDTLDDICAVVRNGSNLSGEADGFELERKKRGGLRLACRRVLRVDGDEPLKGARRRATSGAGARFARVTALSLSPRLHRRFGLVPAGRRRFGRGGWSPRRRGWG
jgi:hypothetical protein